MGVKNKVSKKQSYKLNFIIDQEVKETMEKYVPSGSRSRVVNDALRKELNLLKRKEITAQLAEIREKNVMMDTAEIVNEVKKGRAKDQ
jgi:hypothetical protein